MNAVDYLRTRGRMTKDCEVRCVDCLIGYNQNEKSLDCEVFESKHPEKAVAIVENWAKENPPKTYLSVLLEKLPHTRLHNDNDMPYPTFCPHSVFNIEEKCPPTNCCDCWNREYKEVE